MLTIQFVPYGEIENLPSKDRVLKLLDIVKELRKVKDWKDVEKELKKEKKIAKVDLKNKKVLIEL